MNTILPSVGMLPVADLAKVLNEVYDIAKKGDVATDTQNVGGVTSARIALAISDEDRNTVFNAQRLGDISASQYVTNAQIESVLNFTDNASSIFSDEIRSLRDELYQMKAELAKNGFINDYMLYEGFYDLFKIGKELTTGEDKFIGRLVSSMEIDKPSTLYTQGNIGVVSGEWIIIHSAVDPTAGTPELKQLAQVLSYNGATLVLSKPLQFALNKDYTTITKLQGQYCRGGYTFSQTKNEFPTGDKTKVILVDDYNTRPFSITANKAGYAVNFKVPNSAAGALIEFTVRAKRYGSPGVLNCRVYKGSHSVASVNMLDLVGTSTSVSRIGENTIFSFIKSDGSYPKLLQSIPEDATSGWYCFVIDAETANDLNYWDLIFSYNSNNAIDSDLQTNNTSFVYSPPNTLEVTGITPYDMYFELTTRKIAINPELPFNEGLYTAGFRLPDPINASRARLTLRAAREGNWVVKSPLPGNATGASKQVFIEKSVLSGDTYNGPDMGFRTGDKIVIGSFIRTLTNAIPLSNSSLTLDDGVYLPAGAQTVVHRIGYKVYLKSWREEWNQTVGNYVITGAPKCTRLDISAVLPDGAKPNLEITDRLIFEGDIKLVDSEDNAINANCFELQIIWNSFINYESITNDAYKTELIGRINDFVLSFDRALYEVEESSNIDAGLFNEPYNDEIIDGGEF